MRYGENPQQDADFYQKALPTAYSIASAQQLNGKELSFNNIRDADAAIRVIRDFKDRPTVVALKHMNPCGIGQADDIETAWDYAYEADSVSIFGGIVVLNREVDAATAEKMHAIFLEIIIAPSYTDEALAILTTKKKNLRILQLPLTLKKLARLKKSILAWLVASLCKIKTWSRKVQPIGRSLPSASQLKRKKLLLNLLGKLSSMSSLMALS